MLGDISRAEHIYIAVGYKDMRKQIDGLSTLVKEIDTFPLGNKVKVRQEKSKPLVDDLFSWCADAQDKSLAQSKIGKEIQYALNLEKGLRVYLDDGLVPMTNSLNERNIRSFTVSRKNWLFAASTKGADASALIFSLIETANKANRLSPFDYIEYILEIMQRIDIIQHPEKIDWFMPWSD